MNILLEFEVADISVRYIIDRNESVGLILFPTSLTNQLAVRRRTLRGEAFIDALPDPVPPTAIVIDPLIHLKLVGDSYSGAFAQGRTMRAAPSNGRFHFAGQDRRVEQGRHVVVTKLTSKEGLGIEHRLSWRDDQPCMNVVSSFINKSHSSVTLEMITSFSLGGLTPFAPTDAPGRLQVHRFRSVWSAEGRLQTQSVEEMHLERSWSGAGLFSERFGQLGTMPVRGWFPFVAVEDTQANVTWGAQLSWAGSWQMEVSRQHDDLCISGGLADREFGHWTKTLAPGETFQSPAATLSCVRGSLDDLCDRLTGAQTEAADAQPAVEQTLPIIFNEWCTTWGDPRHDRVVSLADRLSSSPVKYLVIDAGWYKTDKGEWGNGHGDWIPSLTLFPHGLAATAAAIRERGLIPGLWFEMETVGDAAVAFSMVDHLLKRDGLPITVRNRRFWNLNDPVAIDYLAERVIGTLRDCNFGYLKVDYNETAGLGCDGFESQGEGLRRQVEGIHRLFDRIRAELPDLVIENCSSGGHRLEPGMLARTAMSSFSDAHELPEIPLIAANLHRLMLPRQSQIWAVLRASDDPQRLNYSLAATFLGRMCISGEIDQLNPAQWEQVEAAMRLYKQAAPIIRNGISRRLGIIGSSWRHPSGWQCVRRVSYDGHAMLLVFHAFSAPALHCAVPLPSPAEDWLTQSVLSGNAPSMQENCVVWEPYAPFCADVVLMVKSRKGRNLQNGGLQ
jgi:alpha-galactosidase